MGELGNVHAWKADRFQQLTDDHFGVDAEGKQLFGTAVEDRMVVVFDFGRGKLVKAIAGVHEPRAVLYRSDLSTP